MPPSLKDQDVDEDIASDWNKILDGATADELVGEAESRATETETTATDAGSDANADTDTPTRDRGGRFRAGTRPAEREAAAPPEDKQQPNANQQRQPQGQQPNADQLQDLAGKPIDINRPPSTWRPTARAAWATLPEAVRTEIYKREGDYLHAQQELRNDATFGREFNGVIQPFRDLIARENSTPVATVTDLLQTSARLRGGTQVEKYQTMVNIANRFGINLRDLAGRLSGGTPQPGQPGQQQQPPQYRDPRVDQLLHSMHTQEQNRVVAETRAVESQALGWMNEADATGNPLRPYAGDVVEDMVPMLSLIKSANPSWTNAQVMQNAYERAIWANPEIRALLQAEQTRAAGATPADNLRRVNGARRAASVNVPRRGSTPAIGKPGTLEETITETARELGLMN